MDYGESILLSLAVRNVGTVQADNVSVTLSTIDTNITITDNNHIYGNIPADESILAVDAFSFTVASNIPDEHVVMISVAATDGTDTWNSYLSIDGHAPALSIGLLSISDPDGNNNGLLDPGETATLSISVSNNGSSISPEAIANLGTTSSYISLDNTSDDLGSINTGSTVDASFNISVSPTAPIGETVNLDFDVMAEDYSASKPFVTSIGLIVEDWETGDFNKFPWTMSGSADWIMETNNPSEGIYSAKSGNISDSQTSNLEIIFNIISDGEITFYRKVSSEGNWDYLRFFIDGNQIDQWSGELSWAHVGFPVTAGTHTFKWQYFKDGSISSGSDCAWIDYIIFPGTSFGASFGSNETNICENESVSFYDQSPGNPISWDWVFEGGTPGTSTLQNPVIEYSNSGIYDVSLTVSDGTTTDTKNLEDFITVSALPETAPTPQGPISVCGTEETSSYNTTGLTGITEYNWLLEPVEAGSVSGNGLTVSVFWTIGYLGEATLQVAGENLCGTGDYSEAIVITRYLPEVTLGPFDWVCLNWPEIELYGGMPPGGEYSGQGVENGWFYPAVAGVGTHTITYTYSDPGECENFATETILVDGCTGINSPADQAGITVYPNPTTGTFTIGIEQGTGSIEVIVMNTLNDIVYSYSSKSFSKNKLDVDLSSMAKSVYFVKIKTAILEKTIKVVLK
jgi:PKD repeat protein